MSLAKPEALLTPSPSLDSATRILVVDDEPLPRQYAARILIAEGFLVLEAADGREALDQVRVHSDQLGVVVSDIVMPRLNGVELLQALAVDHPLLPVVLMTGYGTLELAALGITPPCAVLAKPFSPELLVGEVKRCLRGSST